jgi:hypothetical protein
MTTIGTRSTRRQRHESASGRLAALKAVLDAFDVHIAEQPVGSIGPAERAALHPVVRALLPLALDDPAFDVTSTVGPTGVAVRVHHCAERGVTARIVPRSEVPDPRRQPVDAPATDPVGSHVVGELAELLRRRQAPRR